MNKRLILLLLAVACLVPATGFGPARGFEDYADSVRSLPPRMRPFFSEDYRQQVFNAPRPDSLNVRCVGRWPWGPSYEVTAQRDTLYLASGSGVRIVDITTPTNPRHIGQVCAKGLVSQVVIRDSLLYVASQGLEIFNVSNPASPTKRSWLNIPVSDFGLKDSFAVCIADSLRVVNVKDPGNPIRVGASPDSGWSIFVAGNYAYTGSRWSLSVIDISNPRNPQYVNSRGDYVWGIWVRGNHCYYTTGNDGLVILNVENPLNLWEEGRLNGYTSYDLHVVNYFAYLGSFAAGIAYFDVIDVSDSSNPTRIGRCTIPGNAEPFGVWVKSSFTYGFVADWYEGLQVININDPTTPRIDTAAFKADQARDVFVQNSRAYLVDGLAGLKVLDIANIAAPFEIGSYDTVGQQPTLYSVWVTDTLAFLGDDIAPPPTFAVVNVKDAANITRVGSCPITKGWEGQDMYLKSGDSILYSANGSYLDGFRIKYPSTPALVCSLLLGSDQAYGVFVKDSFAYINGSRGLKIANVANLSNPFVVARCTTQSGYGIHVKDSLAYLATSYRGLFIINVSNPAAPFIVDSFTTREDGARDLWIDDTLAYIATWRSFQVVNVRNPANPFEVGYYVPPTSMRRIFYDGRYIYGAAFEGGMIVFERLMTGIAESNGQSQGALKSGVYPNPARTSIVLSSCGFSQDALVRVFDITGRELSEARTTVANLQTRKGMDIGGLKSGVYFILIEKRGNRRVFKITKL